MTQNKYLNENLQLNLANFLTHHDQQINEIKNILKNYSESKLLNTVENPYGLVFLLPGTNYYGGEFNTARSQFVSQILPLFGIQGYNPLKLPNKLTTGMHITNITTIIGAWNTYRKIDSNLALENITKAVQYYGVYYGLRDMFPNFNFYSPMYTQLTTAFWGDKEDYIPRMKLQNNITSIIELISKYFTDFITSIKTTFSFINKDDFNPQNESYRYYNKTKSEIIAQFNMLCPEKLNEISSDNIIDILKQNGNIYKKYLQCLPKQYIKEYLKSSFNVEISDEDFNEIFGENHFDVVKDDNGVILIDDIQTIRNIIENYIKVTNDLYITPYRIFMLKHVVLKDVVNALIAVLKNTNYDVKKNIVFYGYSQGGQLIIELLQLINKLTLENVSETGIYKDLYELFLIKDNILCSYLPGIPLTGKNISEGLKPAQKEIDEFKGACISFNSELSGVNIEGSSIIRKDTRVENKIYAINPLNWKTDQTESLSKFKSIKYWKIQDDNTYKVENLPDRIMGYLDEYGILKISIIKKSDIPLGLITDENPVWGSKFVRGCLHWYDIWFYYNEIAENVLKRYQYFN